MPAYHLDCFNGLAGDMFLGACLDLGMPLELLAEAVAALGLADVSVDVRRTRRGGLAGTRFRVLHAGRPIEGPDPDEDAVSEDREGSPPASDDGEGGARPLAAIRSLVAASGLAPAVKERSLGLFARLAEAEAKVHGVPVERVHLHEVGAVDSIVDLVGAAVAIEHLAPTRLTCGPVNVGGGAVETAHGRLPVPAPATAELLAGVPVYGSPGGELLTPTGAVLLAELVDAFRELPAFAAEKVGYGLGRRELAGSANAVRLWRGEALAAGDREVAVVECAVDDLPGEGFGYLMERLLEAGALDVYFTPIQMKKNRPGTLVTLLASATDLERLTGLLLAESGSLGCRYRWTARLTAARVIETITTPFGAVRIKVAHLGEKRVAAAPEFEDCRELARRHGVPWREIHRAALAAFGPVEVA